MTSSYKERKPLKRTPIKSKSPRKAAKRKAVRAKRPTCAFRGCDNRVECFDLCLKHAKHEADVLVGNFVKREAGGVCAECGTTSYPQWAHLVSRRFLAIRWSLDPVNSVVLCRSCHTRFTHHSEDWIEWIDRKFGAGYHASLLAIRNEPFGREGIVNVLARFGYVPRRVADE